MNKLILTVGLPRSGKSTYAMSQRLPVVNPDGIRKALGVWPFNPETESTVWYLAHMMVKSLFAAGHPAVILDATNMTKARRREWRSKDWTCAFKVFETDMETCMKRAVDNGQAHLLPVIKRMLASYEPVTTDEGDIL